MILRPFFPYYGSCWSMARLYPRPRHDRLIEPFAGSACFSLHHHALDVVLVERDPVIVELWRWLLRVTPAEVLALPDLEPGQSTDDLEVCPAAKSLIGAWEGAIGRTISSRGSAHRKGGRRQYPSDFWSRNVRRRVARQLKAIRHWTVIEGDAAGLLCHMAIPQSHPEDNATWFVDPPFWGRAGSHYRFGSKLIDYRELGVWCRLLPGQVMVREQLGATWLPFEQLGTVNGQRGKSTEVAWFSDERDRPGWRQPELFRT